MCQNRESNPHDCKKNRKGSSKVIEPSVAVELVKDMGECDAVVKVIIINDNATYFFKLRNEYNPAITK